MEQVTSPLHWNGGSLCVPTEPTLNPTTASYPIAYNAHNGPYYEGLNQFPSVICVRLSESRLLYNDTTYNICAQAKAAGLRDCFTTAEMAMALQSAMERGWLNIPILENYYLLAICLVKTDENFRNQEQNLTKQTSAVFGEHGIFNSDDETHLVLAKKLNTVAEVLLSNDNAFYSYDQEVIDMWGKLQSTNIYELFHHEVASGFVLLLNHREFLHGIFSIPDILLGEPLLKLRSLSSGSAPKLDQHFKLKVFTMGLLQLGRQQITEREERKKFSPNE